MNLFGTVLTYAAPSANYRGESEQNRSVIQKVTDGRFDYPIISPEAMRNALREILLGYGLPMNRKRLHDEEQLAVSFQEYPHPDRYADDFLFGYLVAASGKDRQKILAELKKTKRDDRFTFKRDSVLRMNLAKGLEPYRHNAVFTQSPLSAEGSAYQNASTSALLHRETAVTAFQYPFALNINDCKAQPKWTRDLLKAIGELNGVAGNHARSYFEMAPASIVVRLTEQLVAGYETYGFRVDRKVGDVEDSHRFPEVVDETLRKDSTLPGKEFYIGGKIVRQMGDETRAQLEKAGVKLDRDPRRLLKSVAKAAGLGEDKET
jgi:CRISPR-associated protein Cst2